MLKLRYVQHLVKEFLFNIKLHHKKAQKSRVAQNLLLLAPWKSPVWGTMVKITFAFT